MLKVSKFINVETLFSAFERHYSKDDVFPGERHNFWEFLYVIDGCMGMSLEEKIYEITSGKILFIAPMTFHKTWSARETSPHIIIMSFPLSGSGFEKLANGVFDIGKTEDTLIRTALECTQYCLEFDDNIKNQLISNKLEELMLRLLEKEVSPSVQKRDRSTENYKKIIKVMTDNIDKNLSATELCNLCDLSLTTLKKTFKTYSGVSVMKYYNNLRMLKAMDLMRDGKSMAEISEMLNFSSQNYFTEAFKRQCGMTPSDHKRKFVKSEIFK